MIRSNPMASGISGLIGAVWAMSASAAPIVSPSASPELCELHVWAVSNNPADYAPSNAGRKTVLARQHVLGDDPLALMNVVNTSARLLDAKEDDIRTNLQVPPQSKVIIHNEVALLEPALSATLRLSDLTSPCYADLLFSGSMVWPELITYKFYYRDFGHDQQIDITVKGNLGAELEGLERARKTDRERGLEIVRTAMPKFLEQAGKKIVRRLSRVRQAV